MKTIIAGSRDLTDMEYVNDAVAASGYVITEVVSGMARGIDRVGYDWGKAVGIPVKEMPADWRPHGKEDREAGYYRNIAMAEYVGRSGALIAIHDGVSSGTMHMIQVARKMNIRTFVYTPPGFKTAVMP